jgi:hypothetical protein
MVIQLIVLLLLLLLRLLALVDASQAGAFAWIIRYLNAGLKPEYVSAG